MCVSPTPLHTHHVSSRYLRCLLPVYRSRHTPTSYTPHTSLNPNSPPPLSNLRFSSAPSYSHPSLRYAPPPPLIRQLLTGSGCSGCARRMNNPGGPEGLAKEARLRSYTRGRETRMNQEATVVRHHISFHGAHQTAQHAKGSGCG